ARARRAAPSAIFAQPPFSSRETRTERLIHKELTELGGAHRLARPCAIHRQPSAWTQSRVRARGGAAPRRALMVGRRGRGAVAGRRGGAPWRRTCAQPDRHALAQRARADAPDEQPPDVRVRAHIRDLQLERAGHLSMGRESARHRSAPSERPTIRVGASDGGGRAVDSRAAASLSGVWR
ncbi:hypothetical protein OAO87_03555, partial [bacterium]|nr:hypothetical protein [bacterium]